jgi:hypothetical protein
MTKFELASRFKLKMTTAMPAAGGSSKRDAFNWPSLNRKDLLSHTGGLSNLDGFETRTLNMRSK